MSEEKIACLFKTKKCLEIHIFDYFLHSDGPINAFVKYENKNLIDKIEFKDRIMESSGIAENFAKKYQELHKENRFSCLGNSSYCNYSFSDEDELKDAFKKYFSDYKDSLTESSEKISSP